MKHGSTPAGKPRPADFRIFLLPRPGGVRFAISMAGMLLSEADRGHFLAQMRRQINSAVHRRMNALLLDEGWTAEAVAHALFVGAETVREHRRPYRGEGRAGVERLAYQGSAPTLIAPQQTALDAELAHKLYLSAAEVCDFVRREFGTHYTPHAMAKLLRRMGFVWKQPKRVPAKADPVAQRAFLETTLAQLMAEAAANPNRPLYFVDATHPAYAAYLACGWIKKGETQTLQSNHGRVNVTLNGALSWPDRQVVKHEAERITGAEMIALFEDLAQRHPTPEVISVVLDNATYNRAAAVREWLAQPGCRVRLHYLPPYAPNLNLIERLWWFFKNKTLWNTYYPTFGDFTAAIDNFSEQIRQFRPQLASLMTDRFHFIGNTPAQIATS